MLTHADPTHDATAGLTLSAFRRKIQEALEATANPALRHYIRHLYDVYAGNFTASLQGLHCFFDLQAPRAIQRRNQGNQAAANPEPPSQKVNFHYAILSLAASQSRIITSLPCFFKK